MDLPNVFVSKIQYHNSRAHIIIVKTSILDDSHFHFKYIFEIKRDKMIVSQYRKEKLKKDFVDGMYNTQDKQRGVESLPGSDTTIFVQQLIEIYNIFIYLINHTKIYK